MKDKETSENSRFSVGKLFRKTEEEELWEDEPLDEDWPADEYVDIELEEDETGDDPADSRREKLKTVLLALLFVVLLLIGVIAGVKLVRYFTGGSRETAAPAIAVIPSEAPNAAEEVQIPAEENDMPADETDMLPAAENGMPAGETDALPAAVDDMPAGETGMLPEAEDNMPAETGNEELMENSVPVPTVSSAPDQATEAAPAAEPAAVAVGTVPEKYTLPGVDTSNLNAIRDYIQGELNNMAADFYFPNIDELTVNEDCTVFTAICNSVEESAAEQAAVEKIFDFGRMYAAYAGTTPGTIRIDYKNHMGALLWTRETNG